MIFKEIVALIVLGATMNLQAMGQHHEEIEQNATSKATRYEPLFQRIQYADLDLFKEALEGIDVKEVRGPRGETLLHRAALYHAVDIVSYLLEKELDPLVQDDRNDTPIHILAAYPRESADFRKIFDLLLQKAPESSINVIGALGQRPLHRAATRYIEVVKELLERKAEVHAHDIFQETPLDKAITHRSNAIIKVLLSAGAKAELRYYQFPSTLTHAKNSGNQEIIDTIKTAMLNDQELTKKLKAPCRICNEDMSKLPDNDFDKLHGLRCCQTVVHEDCLKHKEFYKKLECPLCKKNPTGFKVHIA